jgi:hypothetical protein
MQCVSCGGDNPDGMKFCGECGTPFKTRCSHCGFENLPKFKFCGECGLPLAGQSKVEGGSDSRLQTLDARPVSYYAASFGRTYPC